MGIESKLMDLAFKKFMRELKNPNSEVSKKFNGMLYGDPQNNVKGLFEQSIDSISPQSTEKNEESLKAELARYKRPLKETFATNALNSFGYAAKGAGSALNLYNSLLGDALVTVSNGLGSKGYDNPFVMANAIAAGKKAIGGVSHVIGDTVGNITQSIAKDISNNAEKERETELLLRQRPSGQFYDARRKLSQ